MEEIGRVKDLAKCYGAGVVGIVTTEMLAGGPPSTDLTYVLPNTKFDRTAGIELWALSCAKHKEETYVKNTHH